MADAALDHLGRCTCCKKHPKRRKDYPRWRICKRCRVAFNDWGYATPLNANGDPIRPVDTPELTGDFL